MHAGRWNTLERFGVMVLSEEAQKRNPKKRAPKAKRAASDGFQIGVHISLMKVVIQ